MDPYDPLLLSRRVRDATAAGVDAAELRTGLWVRDLRGVARPAFVEHDALTTRMSNAVALMSSCNALGGWASLRAQGNTWFDGSAKAGDRPILIHCLPGSQLRVRPGILPTESLVHPDETIDFAGYRVATMARAAFDEMCSAPALHAAVVACDMATSTVSDVPHTARASIERVIGSHHKVRGIVQARKAVGLSSFRSASPVETRTRLIAVQKAGLTRLLVNRPVFDHAGQLLGIADLLDEEAGLVIESDGLQFHGPAHRTKDNHRQERFERVGLIVCRITHEDHREPHATAARIVAARRDALARPAGAWTIQTPAWWPAWRHRARWD